MSCQSAARGGFLRTLHFGAHPRPTGAIGLQNQLRRICLKGNSDPTRPQAPAISSVQWMSQSNSFATASADPESTAGSETKKSSDKTKKNKKKPLTEAQKEKKKDQEHKAQIAQLKKTALTPPKKLPASFFSLAFAEKYSGIKDGSQLEPKEAFKAAVAQAKSLSAEDEEVRAPESFHTRW
jgi:hypothetical protein